MVSETYVYFFEIPKTFLLLSKQQNVSQRSSCIQKEREDILYYLMYKLSNKATKMLYFKTFDKYPKFGRVVRTLDCA